MEYFIEQIRIVLPVLGLEFLKESGAALVKAELKLDAAPNGEVANSLNSVPIENVRSTISSQYGRFRPSTRGTRSPEFELKDQRTGVLARAFEIDGEMVVLKDSTARKEAGDSLSGSAEVKRISLINSRTLRDSPNDANLYVFSTDTPFSSPSQASAVILARSDNGRTSWRVRGAHTTYAAWQEEQLGLVIQADYSDDE